MSNTNSNTNNNNNNSSGGGKNASSFRLRFLPAGNDGCYERPKKASVALFPNTSMSSNVQWNAERYNGDTSLDSFRQFIRRKSNLEGGDNRFRRSTDVKSTSPSSSIRLGTRRPENTASFRRHSELITNHNDRHETLSRRPRTSTRDLRKQTNANNCNDHNAVTDDNAPPVDDVSSLSNQPPTSSRRSAFKHLFNNNSAARKLSPYSSPPNSSKDNWFFSFPFRPFGTRHRTFDSSQTNNTSSNFLSQKDSSVVIKEQNPEDLLSTSTCTVTTEPTQSDSNTSRVLSELPSEDIPATKTEITESPVPQFEVIPEPSPVEVPNSAKSTTTATATATVEKPSLSSSPLSKSLPFLALLNRFENNMADNTAIGPSSPEPTSPTSHKSRSPASSDPISEPACDPQPDLTSTVIPSSPPRRSVEASRSTSIAEPKAGVDHSPTIFRLAAARFSSAEPLPISEPVRCTETDTPSSPTQQQVLETVRSTSTDRSNTNVDDGPTAFRTAAARFGSTLSEITEANSVTEVPDGPTVSEEQCSERQTISDEMDISPSKTTTPNHGSEEEEDSNDFVAAETVDMNDLDSQQPPQIETVDVDKIISDYVSSTSSPRPEIASPPASVILSPPVDVSKVIDEYVSTCEPRRSLEMVKYPRPKSFDMPISHSPRTRSFEVADDGEDVIVPIIDSSEMDPDMFIYVPGFNGGAPNEQQPEETQSRSRAVSDTDTVGTSGSKRVPKPLPEFMERSHDPEEAPPPSPVDSSDSFEKGLGSELEFLPNECNLVKEPLSAPLPLRNNDEEELEVAKPASRRSIEMMESSSTTRRPVSPRPVFKATEVAMPSSPRRSMDGLQAARNSLDLVDIPSPRVSMELRNAGERLASPRISEDGRSRGGGRHWRRESSRGFLPVRGGAETPTPAPVLSVDALPAHYEATGIASSTDDAMSALSSEDSEVDDSEPTARVVEHAVSKLARAHRLLDNRGVRRAHLCGDVDLRYSSRAAGGWECGHLSAASMLSNLLLDATAGHALRRAGVFDAPEIDGVSKRIERAWAAGFDEDGAAKYKGKLDGRHAYLGATEVAVLLVSAGVSARARAFPATSPRERRAFFDWIFAYLERCCSACGGCSLHKHRRLRGAGGGTKYAGAVVPPLFVSWPGRACLVVGAERTRKGDVRLLVLEPTAAFADALEARSVKARVAAARRGENHPQWTTSKEFHVVYVDHLGDSNQLSGRRISRKTRSANTNLPHSTSRPTWLRRVSRA